MNTIEVEELLHAELQTVERQLSELGPRNTETGAWSVSAGDIDKTATEPDEIADNAESTEERQEEARGLEARRQDIIRAIEKIDENTYGNCDACGKAIEESRLAANPAAHTCVEHV